MNQLSVVEVEKKSYLLIAQTVPQIYKAIFLFIILLPAVGMTCFKALTLAGHPVEQRKSHKNICNVIIFGLEYS